LAAVPSIGRAARVEGGLAPEADLTRALYEQYANQIFRYCLHQLGSREEAEDAVQSTFLNAFRGIKRGVVPELESAWLFKIAHNVCLSRRRTSWRRGRIESPTDFDVVEELTPAPARRSDELIGLQDVLEQMPENQRRAILLREWQGLSYREIADELELSQAAVETLIFRARRALANGLEQPPQTKRRIVRGTDLGNFLAGLKSLLLGGGAAVKIAATVAVVSASAVVAASPVQQHRASTHPAPAQKPAPVATPQPSRGSSAIVAGPAAAFPAKSGGHGRSKLQRSAAVAFAQINHAPTPDPSTIAAPPEPAAPAAAPSDSAPAPAAPAPSAPAASAPAAAQPAASSATPVSDKTTTAPKATKSDTSATTSMQSGTTQSGTTQSGTTQSGTTQSTTTQSTTTQSTTTQSGTTQSGTTQASQGSSSSGGTADSTSSTSDQRASSSSSTTTTTPVPVNVKTVATPITVSAPAQKVQTTPMPPVTTTPTTPVAPVSTQATTGQSSSSPSAAAPKAVTPVATTPSAPATTTASTPTPAPAQTAKPAPIATPVQIVTQPAPSSSTVSVSSGATSIGKIKTSGGNNN
jgi:RNA polymerase sigma factor (sigma-70 family)